MNNNKSFEQQWADFSKWWSSPTHDADARPIEANFADHPLFNTAMAMSRSMLSVIDLRTMQCLFTAGEVEEITGVDKEEALKGGVKYIFEKIHHDDRIVGHLFGQLAAPYYKAQQDAQKMNYKTYWDFRYVLPSGMPNRVLTQDSILKHDADGNMILLLSLITEIGASKSDRCNHFRMTNGAENHLYEYNQEDKKLYTLEMPSNRELEVFRHISQGHQRKQIADRLGISLATVKTHCQHTFEKLRTNDSVETINLLRIFGLL